MPGEAPTHHDASTAAGAAPGIPVLLPAYRLPRSRTLHGSRHCRSVAHSQDLVTEGVPLDDEPRLHCRSSEPSWQQARAGRAAEDARRAVGLAARGARSGDAAACAALLDWASGSLAGSTPDVRAYAAETAREALAAGAVSPGSVHRHLTRELVREAVSGELFGNDAPYESMCAALAEAATSHVEQALGLAVQGRPMLGHHDVRSLIGPGSRGLLVVGEELVSAAGRAVLGGRADLAPLAAAAPRQVAGLLQEAMDQTLDAFLDGPQVIVDFHARDGALAGCRLVRHFGSGPAGSQVALPRGVADLLVRLGHGTGMSAFPSANAEDWDDCPTPSQVRRARQIRTALALRAATPAEPAARTVLS